MNWVKTRLFALIEVVHSPGAAFTRDLEGPSYLVPFVVLGCLFLALSMVQGPVQLEWMMGQMTSAGAPPEQIAASAELMRKSNLAGVVFVPLSLLLRWSLFALLIWLSGQLFLDQLDYPQVLTVVGYSYVPILLRDTAICAVLLLRDDDLRQRADGISVALGLNLLWPQVPMPWAAALGNINLFEAWFVTLLAIGVAETAGTSWRRGFALVLPNWLFVALVQFGFVSLGVSLQNQFRQG